MTTAKEKTEEIREGLRALVAIESSEGLFDGDRLVEHQLCFLKDTMKLIDCDVSLSKALNYHTVEDLEVDINKDWLLQKQVDNKHPHHRVLLPQVSKQIFKLHRLKVLRL